MFIQFEDDYQEETRQGKDGEYVARSQTLLMFFPEDGLRYPLTFESRVPEGGYDPDKTYRLNKKAFAHNEYEGLALGKYVDVVECTADEASWLQNPPKRLSQKATPKAV